MAGHRDAAPPPSTQRRRIALVITRSDAVGGAQIHVLELAKALRDQGHHVAVFVGGEGPFVRMLKRAKVPVWSLQHLVRELRPLREIRALQELHTALAAFGPDLITTHSTKAGWWGRVTAHRLGVPVVHTAHGWLLTPGGLNAEQRVVQAAEWTAGRISDQLLCVSEYDRRIAIEYGIVPDARISVVHNSVPDISPELRADPGRVPPRVVVVSRLQWPKEPITIIAALAQLQEHAWELEIIGDGPDRGSVEAAIEAHGIQDRVSLLGTRDDVVQRLRDAQLFALASHREGFPVSVLEAMRAGLPVVATDVGGIGEAVAHQSTGILVEPGSANAMAAGLRPLLTDAGLRSQYGAASRERFVQEFSYAHHVRKVWNVYAEVLSRS